jgi:hypothetical protein
MLVADCDLRRGLHAKRLFDSVGHYEVPYLSRAVMEPSVQPEVDAESV